MKYIEDKELYSALMYVLNIVRMESSKRGVIKYGITLATAKYDVDEETLHKAVIERLGGRVLQEAEKCQRQRD